MIKLTTFYDKEDKIVGKLHICSHRSLPRGKKTSLYLRLEYPNGYSYVELPKKFFKSRQVNADYQEYWDFLGSSFLLLASEYEVEYIDKVLSKEVFQESVDLFIRKG